MIILTSPVCSQDISINLIEHVVSISAVDDIRCTVTSRINEI